MQIYDIFSSWLTTRLLMRKDEQHLASRRDILWERLQPSLAATPEWAPLAGMPLDYFPVLESNAIRGNLKQWNSLGIEHKDGLRAAEDAEKGGAGEAVPGIIAGYSTGTSGSRGLFLASVKERSFYIGQSLAKLLPAPSLSRGIRIALFLRANSRLYRDVGITSFFRFSYFPLSLTPAEKIRELEAFQPTILIAPSHVLHELAQNISKGSKILPFLVRCFYGAEPMGHEERDWITSALGVRPDPIYQATEGFLGYGCRCGRLHLNDDSQIIELNPVAGTNGFQPVITDLMRVTQPMVRIKLDDFIELDDTPCPCGFAGRVIQPVSGRVQDLWRFDQKIIKPSELTQIIEATIGPSHKWKAIGSRKNIKIHLETPVSEDRVQAMTKRLMECLRFPFLPEIVLTDHLGETPKRRRVCWDMCHE